MDSQSQGNLSESWIEVSFPSETGALLHANVEQRMMMSKLLKDAQDGSGKTSKTGSRSSRGTPPSPPPSREEGSDEVKLRTADWISDWSSRPEVNNGTGQWLDLPPPVRRGYSLRHSSLMHSTSIWPLDNLPALIVSHACCIIIGAAAMFVLMKKYRKWVPSN